MQRREYQVGELTPGPLIYNQTASEVDASGNMIGSSQPGKGRGPGSMHLPVIDLDLPVRLVESSTPGHFHLYIDHEVEWSAYVAMLSAMAAAGIVEQGYLAMAMQNGETLVRAPGVSKKDLPPPKGTGRYDET